MTPPNYISIVIGGLALVVSITSLIITLVQKNKETIRGIRRNLTDTLENISKINIETSKLSSDKSIKINDGLTLRRNYNMQRRILTVNAEYLVNKYDKIVTDIDCNLLGQALAAIGDFEKAEFYWDKSVQKSTSGPIKHMNLRGFGFFLFDIGKVEDGRKRFEEALSIEFRESDENFMFLADTYLILANLEKGANNINESEKNIEKAMNCCLRIRNSIKKEDVHSQIREILDSKSS